MTRRLHKKSINPSFAQLCGQPRPPRVYPTANWKNAPYVSLIKPSSHTTQHIHRRPDDDTSSCPCGHASHLPTGQRAGGQCLPAPTASQLRQPLPGRSSTSQRCITSPDSCFTLQEVLAKPGVNESNLRRHFFTNQAYEDIRGLVGCVRFHCNRVDAGKTNMRYLLPHMCSQDAVEHHFSIVKSFIRGGRLTAEKVEEVSRYWHIFKALYMQGPAGEKTNMAGRDVYTIEKEVKAVNDGKKRQDANKRRRMSAPV